MIPARAIAEPEMLDALQELVNIGIGKAASAIAELCDREVALSVPAIEIYNLDQPRPIADLQQGTVLRVSQSFEGGVTGHALLVLNQGGAERLAALLLGGDQSNRAFDENDQSALLELGNIIMGGVIGTLADHFTAPVLYALPQLQLRGVSGCVDLISDLVEPRTTRILLMQASLSISSERINGYLVLLFPNHRLAELLTRLERLVTGG